MIWIINPRIAIIQDKRYAKPLLQIMTNEKISIRGSCGKDKVEFLTVEKLGCRATGFSLPTDFVVWNEDELTSNA
jgi:hypothetical protein